jgi:hypothetical protein
MEVEKSIFNLGIETFILCIASILLDYQLILIKKIIEKNKKNK